MKFRVYLLSLHVLLIHFLKSGQNFLNAPKIEIVTGEHDVERGGTKLAYLLSLHVLLIHLLKSGQNFLNAPKLRL